MNSAAGPKITEPKVLMRDARKKDNVMKAVFQMHKLDIDTLKKAYAQ